MPFTQPATPQLNGGHFTIEEASNAFLVNLMCIADVCHAHTIPIVLLYMSEGGTPVG
jgi:hypothetical protein